MEVLRSVLTQNAVRKPKLEQGFGHIPDAIEVCNTRQEIDEEKLTRGRSC